MLLAAFMAVSTLGGVTVKAEENKTETEYVETDPYVLGALVGDGSYQYAGYWGFATTPYESKFIIEKKGDAQYSMTDNACLFNLISPDKLENTPESEQVGPWASIIAYCVDVRVDINSDYKYRRLNLEDSEYFEVNAAQRVRSIVNNGITVNTASEVQDLVNAWCGENGKELLTDVTSEEVLTAAQYAIWYVANEKELKGDSTIYTQWTPETWTGVWNHYYDYTFAYATPSGGEVSINSRVPEAENARKNIETMAAYYLALPGTSANQVAISDASIQDMAVEWTMQEDGTYEAEISYSIDTNLDLNTTTDLTISAICGDTNATYDLVKTGADSIVLTGLEGIGDVSLEINGYQKVEDVFFYDAIDDRESSQTLTGYDDSNLPVHAEATVTAERSITVSKEVQFTNSDAELIPTDVTYYIGLFTKEADGSYTLYSKDDMNCVAELTLENDDYGSVTFDGLEDGTYYVFETDEDGNIIDFDKKYTASDNTSWTCVLGGDYETNEVIISSTDAEGSMALCNVYEEVYQNFSLWGWIDIYKEVLVDEEWTETDEVFYAGIFESETAEKPLYDVLQLENGGVVSIKVPCNADGSRTVYYVFETDAEGNKVNGSEGFAYEVKGEGATIINLENPLSYVEIVNSKTTDTPDDDNTTPKPSDDKKNDSTDNKTNTTTKTDTVDTGDSAPVTFYTVLLVVALASVAVILKRRRA